MRKLITSFFTSVALLFVTIVWASTPFLGNSNFTIPTYEHPITPKDSDTIVRKVKLRYPMHDESYGLPTDNDYNGGLYLNTPSNIKTEVTYDTDSNRYNVKQKMGNLQYRPESYMSQDEYMDYEFQKSIKDYWKQRSTAESMSQQQKRNKNLIPPIKINSQIFDRIFGSNVVDIRPQGSAELIFAANTSRNDNPALPVKQRRIGPLFDFDEKIQLSVVGKIGDRMKITTNYNTQATFDFENKMKLEFAGGEDDIIKKIEAGNVSLPLNSTLISGSQSLFGIKTQLQFGRATITAVVSQEKGQKKEINIENGAQTNNFEITADNYESNKHFFLTQFFKERYDSALKALPIVRSAINVTKVEVWITNTSANINETRNVVALTDIGENLPRYVSNKTFVTINANNGVPDNRANNLYPGTFATMYPRVRSSDSAAMILTSPPINFSPVHDFEKVLTARKLAPSEYSFNQALGFISLNTNVNPDQVVAAAFQYTYNGNTYQVGELSTDGVADPKCLLVKLLKSTNVSPRTDVLLWDLMMKNVYSMGAYQVKPDNFKLDIYYNNPASGIDVPVIPETGLATSGKPLLQVMNLDRMNSNGDPVPDGVFDFIDGVTINATNGRIYFPVRKPFGDNIRKKINPYADPNLAAKANKYAYDQLYDSTKYTAQQFPDKNRFKIKGNFKSASGSEIMLNAPNIPEGSVSVTAGGVPLTENVDYTVDYSLGRVKIINDGILQSGTPIKVAFESNLLFGFQQKTLVGTHLDYRINKDFNLGATAILLNERPLMQKVNIGEEPIKNTVVGMDGSYRSEFPFLTRMVDKLPLISTKEMSTVAAKGEVAALIPGHSRVIGKEGTAYIDDFEGSQSPIDIKAVAAWSLASTPQFNPLWPEGMRTDTVYGFNRARLAWYMIDPMFMRQTQNLTPSYYTKEMMSDNYQREIVETELFPKKESSTGLPVPLPTLDLAYYPSERGPYNYDAHGLSSGKIVTAGTNADGSLKNPASRWGGIMRKIETNDFEAANIQFIQLWMIDPFNNDMGQSYNGLSETSGELLVHLGNISEDVLRDGKKSFENGLPTYTNDNTHPTTTTPWGRVPAIQAIVNAFDNDPASRTAQDVGLDGLQDADELPFFNKYINAMGSVSSVAQATAKLDPSSDNYHYYRGDDYDAASLGTLQRYKKFNGVEGNSPVSTGSYPTSSTTLPNTEDINRDNNLSENEGYYQYRVKISKKDLSPTNIGNNYINDVIPGGGSTMDGNSVDVNWYQIKIPIREFEAKYGSIDDFKSVRFIRMALRGFNKPVVLRLAKVELIRGEWRKYAYDLATDGEYISDDNKGTGFDISAVNYEENGTKKPVNYVLPPKIEQQLSYGSTVPIHLNEQSMSLKVCNLEDGDARATYKNVNLDVRTYKKLRMFIHAEAQANGAPLHDDDLTYFIRLGTDYTQNYYEYEIPLKVTPSGNYQNTSESDRYVVWKEANEMALDFSSLQDAKTMRNSAMYAGKASLGTRFPITVTDESGRSRNIYIKGNPNLSAVKTIMIGIRNPKRVAGPNAEKDDGLPKCGEVWVDELRLADFNEKGGWASTGNVTTKLADLGTLSLAGNYSTPGWGSIDKKVGERQKETRYQYDISTQLLLHKFLPINWGINIPMYIGYSQAIIRPQYNPLDPDIYLSSSLDVLPNDSMRNDLKRRTIDETDRSSINFTNVRKERPKNSIRNYIFDIENLAFNYSFSKFHNHNALIDHNDMRDYRAGVIYGYSTSPKNIQPFKKISFLNKKTFSLIRDFNFNPYPDKYVFTADVNRHYGEKLDRNTTGLEIPMIPYFDKKFTMIRTYDVKYELTKALKLDFHADNNSRIMEPYGAINTQEKKDTIRQNLLKGGVNTIYSQHLRADYVIPISKIPILDWVSANASYTTDYKWTRGPFSADSLGNVIQNGNQKSLNTQANMMTLYNKIPFFRKINQGIKKSDDKKRANKNKTTNTNTPPNQLNQANKLPERKSTKDSTKKKPDFIVAQYIARTLMMLKNVSANYTNNQGMALAGYSEGTSAFGLNKVNNTLAPGFGFVLGQQSNFGTQKQEFTDYAADRGWLVKNSFLNTPFTNTLSENITGRASIEPFPGLKIELNATKNRTKNYNEFFRWTQDSATGNYGYLHQSPTESGSFSMSFITWKTAFENIKSDYSSKAFSTFLANRSVISSKLAAQYNNSAGTYTDSSGTSYYQGYGPTSQATLMYAFLSAYSGKNPESFPLKAFPNIPVPNWRITYDGLSRIKPLSKIFKTITLSHAYRSSYSFSYTNNLNSGLSSRDKDPTPIYTDVNNNFMFYQQINSVSIAEQLSPLIKVDVTLQNNIQFNIEAKKERMINLSFSNNQLTEVRSHEFVIGSGYRWKNLDLLHLFSKEKKSKNSKVNKSDLNLRADFSIRQNLTVIRKVVENVTQPTAGQTNYSLKTSADYMITQRINARLFYDWIFTNPRISTSFRTSNTNAGISIRFSLN